jgi:hypothetical protein
MPSWSEATVEIDGERFTVGSLHGEPNTAFLQMAWLRSLERRLRGSPSSPPCVGHQIFCRCGRRNRCCDLWARRWHPSGMPMLLRIGFPAVSPSSTAGYRLESLRDEGRQESMAQVAPTRMPEASQQVAGGRAQRYHRLQIRRTRASRQGLSLNSRPSTLNFLTASSQSP